MNKYYVLLLAVAILFPLSIITSSYVSNNDNLDLEQISIEYSEYPCPPPNEGYYIDIENINVLDGSVIGDKSALKNATFMGTQSATLMTGLLF